MANYLFSQLLLKSNTKYYPEGSLIADSKDLATGLMVITAGMVSLELSIDSSECNVKVNNYDGKARTSLYTFGRGYAPISLHRY